MVQKAPGSNPEFDHSAEKLKAQSQAELSELKKSLQSQLNRPEALLKAALTETQQEAAQELGALGESIETEIRLQAAQERIEAATPEEAAGELADKSLGKFPAWTHRISDRMNLGQLFSQKPEMIIDQLDKDERHLGMNRSPYLNE